ncbi:OTU domain-containing protein OS=Streptomyces fumanus OX=67302 GN=GCM10018772_56770 PE=4 SV=1 [Streptomyces fumanus]
MGLGEGRHRGVTRAGTETGIGTVYAWDGTRLVTYRFRVDIGIERVNKPGGAVTGPLVRWYRSLDAARSAPFTDTVTGVLSLQVPRGLSEFRPVYGPRAAPDPRPLPPLPGDAYVSGVAMDGVERAALRLAGRVFGEHAAGGTSRASLALLRLLTPRQMAEHVRRASQAAPLLLTDSLLDPADPSRRAALYLRGALYDLEVIGPVAGTGTGRYSKYQKGTSVNAADDHWRASATASASGSGVVQAPEQADARPPHTLGGDTGASRTTAGGQGGTGSENQRREEHLKQQGPVYSVLLRWRGRLEARPYSRPLLGPAGRPGKKTLYGETFTGDVYAELFQSEVEELRARHRQVPDPAGDARPAAAHRTASPSFDLAGLLADAAREPGAGAHRLHQAVARTISAGTDGTPETVTFHLDRTALLRRVHRDVLRWAVDALGARLAGDHAAGPGREARAALARYRTELARQQVDGRTVTEGAVHAIVAEVDRHHDALSAGTPSAGPVVLPTAASLPALSTGSLVRGIARELGRPVRLRVRGLDGVLRSHLVTPSDRDDTGLPGTDTATASPATASARPAAPAVDGVRPPGAGPDTSAGPTTRRTADAGATPPRTADTAPPATGRAAEPALTAADRDRVGDAFRRWPATGQDALPALEGLLRAAGAGARSLVLIDGEESRVQLYAVNLRGRVEWLDARSRTRLDGAPSVAGTVWSLDLDAHGTLLDRVLQGPQQGPDAVRFPTLRLGADLMGVLGDAHARDEEPEPASGPDTAARDGAAPVPSASRAGSGDAPGGDVVPAGFRPRPQEASVRASVEDLADRLVAADPTVRGSSSGPRGGASRGAPQEEAPADAGPSVVRIVWTAGQLLRAFRAWRAEGPALGEDRGDAFPPRDATVLLPGFTGRVALGLGFAHWFKRGEVLREDQLAAFRAEGIPLRQLPQGEYLIDAPEVRRQQTNRAALRSYPWTVDQVTSALTRWRAASEDRDRAWPPATSVIEIPGTDMRIDVREIVDTWIRLEKGFSPEEGHALAGLGVRTRTLPSGKLVLAEAQDYHGPSGEPVPRTQAVPRRPVVPRTRPANDVPTAAPRVGTGRDARWSAHTYWTTDLFIEAVRAWRRDGDGLGEDRSGSLPGSQDKTVLPGTGQEVGVGHALQNLYAGKKRFGQEEAAALSAIGLTLQQVSPGEHVVIRPPALTRWTVDSMAEAVRAWREEGADKGLVRDHLVPPREAKVVVPGSGKTVYFGSILDRWVRGGRLFGAADRATLSAVGIPFREAASGGYVIVRPPSDDHAPLSVEAMAGAVDAWRAGGAGTGEDRRTVFPPRHASVRRPGSREPLPVGELLARWATVRKHLTPRDAELLGAVGIPLARLDSGYYVIAAPEETPGTAGDSAGGQVAVAENGAPFPPLTVEFEPFHDPTGSIPAWDDPSADLWMNAYPTDPAEGQPLGPSAYGHQEVVRTESSGRLSGSGPDAVTVTAAAERGLRVADVPADGDCFFHSLIAVVGLTRNGLPLTPAQVRFLLAKPLWDRGTGAPGESCSTTSPACTPRSGINSPTGRRATGRRPRTGSASPGR